MNKKLIISYFCLLSATTCFADTNIYDIFYGIQKSIDTVSDIQRLRNNQKEAAIQNQNIAPPQIERLPETMQNSNFNVPKEKKEFPTLIPFFNDRLGLYGYQTLAGEMVISPKFYDAKVFSEGLAAVYDGSRWGYINENGEYEINPAFGGYSGDQEIVVHPFVNGTAAVYLGSGNANGFADIKEGEYALIDRKGYIIKIFDCIYPNWYGYSKGNIGEYQATINNTVYIVDSQGNILRQEYSSF